MLVVWKPLKYDRYSRPYVDWILGGVAIALLCVGLVGQGFEMRRMSAMADAGGTRDSPSIFADRRNFKWYALIGAAIVMWFVAERL